MTATVTIKPEIDDLKKRIIAIVADPDKRRRVLIRATLELADRMRVYPPEGAYNREPGTRGRGVWYQRQFGTRWRRKDGTMGGTDNSQRLQKSWKTEIQTRSEFVGSVSTAVTYAPYLFDPEKRVSWAASHGWKTTKEIAEDYTPRFTEIVIEQIRQDIADLDKG